MATIHVGAGRAFTRLGAITPAPAPGDVVLVDPGHYAPAVDSDTLTWSGSLAAPITVRPADPARPPVWRRTINLHGCRHVCLEGVRVDHPVTVSGARSACIILGGAGFRNTVIACRTRGGLVGVQVNDNAGLGHRIEGCEIRATQRAETAFIAGNGIGVSPNNVGTAHTREGRCVEIVGNTICDAAGHGMEVQGKYGLILGNTVLGAGTAIRGCSGIHLLNADRWLGRADGASDEGQYWHVVNNIVAHVKTATEDDGNGQVFQQDGNGIQVDHGCRFILLQGNICYENDGAGIAIYDGADGQIWFNSLRANGRDFDNLHVHRGEITFGSNENLATQLANWSVIGNVCEKIDGAVNAIGFGLVPHVVQLTYNVPSHVPTIRFRDNIFRNAGGNANGWRWRGATYTSIAGWNGARPSAGANDSDAAPGWVNPSGLLPEGWAVSGAAATMVASRPDGLLYPRDLAGTLIPETNAAAGALQRSLSR